MIEKLIDYATEFLAWLIAAAFAAACIAVAWMLLSLACAMWRWAGGAA